MERALAGRFRLEEKLGGDDVAEVHRARDAREDRSVRVHLVRVEAGSRRERVLREAKRAAQLRHPGLVAILDVGRSDDDEAFIVTDEPKGETLATIAARGKMESRAAAEIAAQVCRALAVAHDAGVVHRDLRPSRVFVREENGQVVVVVQGLGLPHPTAARDDGYVAPEQRRGEPVGRRADVYSIGAMLHAMLTGAPPGADAAVEGPLAEIVARGLAPDPRERFLDTVELETAMRNALDPPAKGASKAPSVSPGAPTSRPPSAKPASSKPPVERPRAASSKPPAPPAIAIDELAAQETTESTPRSEPPRRASARPLGAERRAPAAPPPRALGRPLAPRPKWEDALLDVLDGPAPRVAGGAIAAFVLTRILASGLLPFVLALGGALAGFLSWRMSRARPPSQ